MSGRLEFSWAAIASGLAVGVLLSQLNWPWPFFVLLGDLALLPGDEHWLYGDNHQEVVAVLLVFVGWLTLIVLQRWLSSHRTLRSLKKTPRRVVALAGAFLMLLAALWLYSSVRGTVVYRGIARGAKPSVVISMVHCYGPCRSRTLILTTEPSRPGLKPPLFWYPFQHAEPSVNNTVRLTEAEMERARRVLVRRSFFGLPRRMDFGPLSNHPLFLGVQFQTDVGAHGVVVDVGSPNWDRVEIVAEELLGEFDLEWPEWPEWPDNDRDAA